MNVGEIGRLDRQGRMEGGAYVGRRLAPDRLIFQRLQMVDHLIEHPMALGPQRIPIGGIKRGRGICWFGRHDGPCRRHRSRRILSSNHTRF